MTYKDKQLVEAASKAYDVAAEQLPDIAYQFITYNRLYLTFIIVATVVAAIVLYTSIYKLVMKDMAQSKLDLPANKRTDYFSAALPLIFISILYTVFIAIPVLVVNLKPLFMVWIAPKIFLILEIKNLVSGK